MAGDREPSRPFCVLLTVVDDSSAAPGGSSTTAAAATTLAGGAHYTRATVKSTLTLLGVKPRYADRAAQGVFEAVEARLLLLLQQQKEEQAEEEEEKSQQRRRQQQQQERQQQQQSLPSPLLQRQQAGGKADAVDDGDKCGDRNSSSDASAPKAKAAAGERVQGGRSSSSDANSLAGAPKAKAAASEQVQGGRSSSSDANGLAGAPEAEAAASEQPPHADATGPAPRASAAAAAGPLPPPAAVLQQQQETSKQVSSRTSLHQLQQQQQQEQQQHKDLGQRFKDHRGKQERKLLRRRSSSLSEVRDGGGGPATLLSGVVVVGGGGGGGGGEAGVANGQFPSPPPAAAATRTAPTAAEASGAASEPAAGVAEVDPWLLAGVQQVQPGQYRAALPRAAFEELVGSCLEAAHSELGIQREDLALACSLRERRSSVCVLLCGTSGTGKSTLASLTAQRLGITSVVSTDSVRHMLRSFEDRSRSPLLWVSTYQAGEYIAFNNPPGWESVARDPRVLAVKGYKAQCEMVLESLDRLIGQYEARGESLVVEGVHLSLNFVARVLMPRHPSVVPFLVHISNEAKHRERFAVRAKYMTLEPSGNRYVAYFRTIRCIQDYLVRQAGKGCMPKVDNTNVDRSVATIHATVLGCLRRRARGEPLLDAFTRACPAVLAEYLRCRSATWSSKDMVAILRRKRSSGWHGAGGRPGARVGTWVAGGGGGGEGSDSDSDAPSSSSTATPRGSLSEVGADDGAIAGADDDGKSFYGGADDYDDDGAGGGGMMGHAMIGSSDDGEQGNASDGSSSYGDGRGSARDGGESGSVESDPVGGLEEEEDDEEEQGMEEEME